MPFWRKETETVIINEVDDEPDDVQVTPKNAKQSKKKKKKEEKGNKGNDSMADLTEEATEHQKNDIEYKKHANCMDHILFNTKLRLLYVVILCLFLGIFIPYILANTVFMFTENVEEETCALNVSYRFPCLPGRFLVNEDYCRGLGCCYDPNQQGDVFAPTCFHKVPSMYRYRIANITKGDKYYRLGTDTSLTLYLESRSEFTPFLGATWGMKVLIQRVTNSGIRIKLWNDSMVYDPEDDVTEEVASGVHQLDVKVVQVGETFNITVLRCRDTVARCREDDNETIPLFETVFGPLVYGKDYMEITTRVPTQDLYGLGQRERELFDFLPNYGRRTRWTLYNREFNPALGTAYGAHPFYMAFEPDGKMHGVYLKNSAPVEVGVLPIPAIAFRSFDAVFDFRIFPGPTPREVSRQYTEMVGMPAMPPLWALGYHLCRASTNYTAYESTVARMESDEVPYESDCIDARMNFPDSFADLNATNKQRIADMKARGRKFFPAQYPFVPVTSGAYENGKEYFLKLPGDQPYYGAIEDTVVGYPDYCNENTFHLWLKEAGLSDLFQEADGMMLFMNTPLNQAKLNYTMWIESNGTSCDMKHPQACCPPDIRSFKPSGITDLNNGTTCPVARHSSKDATSVQLHNDYGRCHHQRMDELMKSFNSSKRTMITSLSTHPGSGKFGGHFGGEYPADFVAQRKALIQILEMGLYGVPLVGMPVCGSTNASNELKTEWCLRSHQTSAFWPFMMSYYEFGHTPRNPSDFSSGFANQLAYFIRQRYMIIPYMYTLFYHASQTGVPVVRPLFYEFPDDLGSRNNDHQFMLGDALLVTPVFTSLQEGTSVPVPGRIPPGAWYNYYTGALLYSSDKGGDATLNTLLTDVNVHIKGGSIIPLQGNLHENISTTADSRLKAYHLLVALTTNITTTTTTPAPQSSTPSPEGGRNQEINTASGSLYIDDGETVIDESTKAHKLEFTAVSGTLTIKSTASACGSFESSTIIDNVWVYGAPAVSKVTLNNKDIDFTQDFDTFALRIPSLGFNWCDNPSATIQWK